MAGEAAAKTAFDKILDWSGKRPAWQQDAVRRIVAQGHLEDGQLNELIKLCKHENGGVKTDAIPQPLAHQHLPAVAAAEAPITLLSLSAVEGANALAAGQKLRLEPAGLTIIYGDNGAGKSGYARILKRVCRARHSAEIQGNIYAARAPGARATAVLEFAIGGQIQAPANWSDEGRPHAILSAISVFDSDCAAVHIGSKNEVAFRPLGLDVPDELAATCVRIKDLLLQDKKRLEQARNAIFQKPPWRLTTKTGALLSQLKAETKLADITALAEMTAAETERMQQLGQDLANDAVKAAAAQVTRANNLKGLAAFVQKAGADTADAALANIFALVKAAKESRAAALVAADAAFAGELLSGIGAEAWRGLWEAARRYSVETAYQEHPYPHLDDAVCVLCQQPLEAQAKDRLKRFEEFVKQDTEKAAAAAERESKRAQGDLDSLNISLRSVAANLREVALGQPELARRVRRYMAAVRLRRFAVRRAIAAGQDNVPNPGQAASPVAALTQLESDARKYAEELRLAAQGEGRERLEAEMAELRDRAALAGQLETISQEITRLREVGVLNRCLDEVATTAITKFGNDLADEIITPQLRDRFQQEITRLAADKVRVEIVRSGGKLGAPQYQVKFFAKPDARVTDVLSEGEKTCVALAAFMTELATTTNSSALVFDDPVSSLDHRWRRQVAKRLVEETANRQVIVFTHDLVFVNDLTDASRGNAKLVTLSRDKDGPGVVTEGLPWVAKSVEDRLDKLEKDARQAKKLHEANEDENYRFAAVRHYNLLRATWERAIEEVAFFKVVRRHRDYIDTKELKKVSVLTEADCDAFHVGFKKCCDVTDAHDPSVGRNAEAPPPAELIGDVEELKKWVSAIRDRQKLIKA